MGFDLLFLNAVSRVEIFLASLLIFTNASTSVHIRPALFKQFFAVKCWFFNHSCICMSFFGGGLVCF